MKRILFPIMLTFVLIQGVDITCFADTIPLQCRHLYLLNGDSNGDDDGYIGGRLRGTGDLDCDELLVRGELSSLGDKRISNVELQMYIDSISIEMLDPWNPYRNYPIFLYEQDKGPYIPAATFDTYAREPWTNAVGDITFYPNFFWRPDWYTFTNTGPLKEMVQQWVNGTKPNEGLIIGCDFGNRWKYIAISKVRMIVTYRDYTPNYIETATYSALHPNQPILSRTFTDGLGNVLEHKVKQNMTDKVLVSANRYQDADASQLWKTYKPYPKSGDWGVYILPDTAEADAVGYFNDAKPYTVTEYYPDPMRRIAATAGTGNAFSLENGHGTRAWYFSTKENSGNSNLTALGFVRESILDTTTLTTYQAQGGILEPGDMPNLSLTITRDPNGHFSQKITDIFGNVVRSISNNVTNSNENILSQYEYDITGKVLREIPPVASDNPVHPTSYCYNTLGQVMQKNSPDGGVAEYAYYGNGAPCFACDANQKYLWQQGIRKQVHYYTYDDLDRPVEDALLDVSGCPVPDFKDLDPLQLDPCVHDLIVGKRYTVTIKNYYDTVSNCKEEFAQTGLEGQTDFANTRGRIVAMVSYNHVGTDASGAHRVIEAFSYDDDGRIVKKYKIIPRLPLQTVAYSYAVTGEPTQKRYNTGTHTVITDFFYDADGRLSSVKQDGKNVVAYQYKEYGPLQGKVFTGYPAGGSPISHPVTYEYTIRDWLKDITFQSSSQFREVLYYNDPPQGTPQYNGNISALTINKTTPSFSTIALRFTYDPFGRLLMVRNGADDVKNDFLDGDYAYDQGGRIIKKVEGYTTVGTPLLPMDTFQYVPNANKLSHITGSNKNMTPNHQSNYIYDDNGNMVLDRSKKMSVLYDWRNMPVLFTYYDAIPDQQLHWSVIPDLRSQYPVTVLSLVRMTYDASGNRTNKEEFKP